MPRKPTPKVVSEVCSLCGLDWADHGENPTTETCIGLLLDEVKSLNARLAVRPVQPISYPLPVPYPVYPQRPYYPRPYWTTSSQSSGGISGNRPVMSSVVPRALNAA